MSHPWSSLRGVGRVIDLEAWRSSGKLVALPEPPAGETGAGPELETSTRPELDGTILRLEAAISRLDRLVKSGQFRTGSRVEAELLAITGAVSAGRVEQAAEAAERLTERLEHPSSRQAR
jgi:hypothetical protein